MDDDVKRSWIIYRNPVEAPGCYLVRGWSIVPGEEDPIPDAYPSAVVGSLELARIRIPLGLVRFERKSYDDPSIVEMWM